MAIVNSWLIYRKSAEKLSIPEKKISPLALFKLRTAVSFIKNGKASSRPQRGRPSSSRDSTQKIHIKKRRRVASMKVAPDTSTRYNQIQEYQEAKNLQVFEFFLQK